MHNLWGNNTSRRFWQCQPEVSPQLWQTAFQNALPILGFEPAPANEDDLLAMVLGEGQFGLDHWQLSRLRRFYYFIKPLLPHTLTRLARRFHSHSARANFRLHWPIEERYARFQWEVIRQVLLQSGKTSIRIKSFWPEGQQYAFVLTHDIETDEGQAGVPQVIDLEESLGVRSSFNFLPGCYSIDQGLLYSLRDRGFEIGVHGYKHDGRLFNDYNGFTHQAEHINCSLKELNAVGFRAPLTIRNPEWLQDLDIEYDLSFFDSDPFEPIPGGTMSIWPFFIGHFVELPYTMIQDNTLTAVLGETTPRLWFEKVDFIEKYQGMVLLNTHPDYLSQPKSMNIYTDFLHAMRQRAGYWHALPRDVAQWWQIRSESTRNGSIPDELLSEIQLTDDGIKVTSGRNVL